MIKESIILDAPSWEATEKVPQEVDPLIGTYETDHGECRNNIIGSWDSWWPIQSMVFLYFYSEIVVVLFFYV